MRALIVEDEIYNFEIMKNLLLRIYPQMDIEGPVTNLIDLEKAMHNQQNYSVIYCDIRLQDGICFSILENINITTPIIFTTAYDEYALKAFETNGIAYLLKPVETAALQKATEKVLRMQRGKLEIAALLDSIGSNKHNTYLHYIKADTYDGSVIIKLKDVVCFNAGIKNSYALMAGGEKYRIKYTLEQLMQRLDSRMFFRANRQYIVNRSAINRLQSYGSRQLLIKLNHYEDVNVIVSKENVSTLNNWIEQ